MIIKNIKEEEVEEEEEEEEEKEEEKNVMSSLRIEKHVVQR